MSNITLGADVEFFVYENDRPIPAIGLIGGDKRRPRDVTEGNLQEDNVMAEVAIKPAQTLEEWESRINSVYQELMQSVSPYTPLAIPSCQFPDEALTDPKAREFGCDPDLNAYTLEENQISASTLRNYRTCGGHIHVGGFEGDDMTLLRIIFNLDLYLGVPSLFLDHDDFRRTLYGQAGTFRIKDYGLEYRTLSNFWAKDNRLIRWTYNQTIRAVQNALDGHEPDPTIAEVINNSDRGTAHEMVERYNLEVPYVNAP